MVDIRRKMVASAFWVVLFRLTDRLIGFVSTLILARVLAPADFGLVAMAMSILALIEIFSAFSFDIALIQNANSERRHYDTAWTFNVLFGIANAVLLLVLAIPIAGFYAEPRVAGIMAAIAANWAIQGWGNIGVVAFQKDLDLQKEFRLGVCKKLVAFAVTVTLAFTFQSYWALIAGTIASSITGVILSYRMHPYRPRFSLQGHKALFHFSKWMLLNNMLISLANRTPDLMMGKISGPTALGLYSLSYEISNLPTTELVFPISRAVFPGYSRMAAQPDELRSGFVDVLAVILLITVPAGLGIITLAEPFVNVLLGAKWVEAIPLIQVLGIFGILRASSSNMGALFLALGQPRLLTYLTALFLVMMVPSLWLLVPQYGPLGAACTVVVAAAIQVPVGFSIIMRRLSLRFSALLAVLWRPITAGLVMVGMLNLVRSYWIGFVPGDGPGYPVQLLTLVPLGAAFYISSVLCLWFVSGRPIGGESKLITVAELAFEKLLKRGANSS